MLFFQYKIYFFVLLTSPARTLVSLTLKIYVYVKMLAIKRVSSEEFTHGFQYAKEENPSKKNNITTHALLIVQQLFQFI